MRTWKNQALWEEFREASRCGAAFMPGGAPSRWYLIGESNAMREAVNRELRIAAGRWASAREQHVPELSIRHFCAELANAPR